MNTNWKISMHGMNVKDNRSKPIKWTLHKADSPKFTKELEFEIMSN